MFRLKLLLSSLVVIDQSKASAPASTKVCPEAKCNNATLVSFVEGRKLFREIGLGDIRAAGVEDVNDELTARQEAVGDELACSQGNGCSVGLE